MIVIYGRPGCGACENVKKLLTKNNKNFSYIDSSTMDEKGFDIIMQEAMMAGIRAMPIIMEDGKIVTLSDVLN